MMKNDMSTSNRIDPNEDSISISKDQIRHSKKGKLYFWEKWALKPKDEKEDKISFYEVEDDPTIREVIRNFESKILGRKLLFSEVSPKNSSVKKWIDIIRESYPERKDEVIEDLLNTFRGSLYPRSKEKYRLIVGILLLNDVMLVAHCKKDPSLAEWEDKIYSVKLILHPKNVLRVAIIRNENGKTTFSAFEYNRKWSKGHAEFWGIEPEDVSWESLGSIFLTVELNGFPYSIQLPIESEQLDEMVKNRSLSPTGKIRIGREEGKITKVEVFRTYMNFSEFYDFYVTGKEKLEEHRKKFKELVSPHAVFAYDMGLADTYKYEEKSEKIFEITPEGDKIIHDKKNPRYTICFFTKSYPKIRPMQGFIDKLYQSIFENNRLEIWHAGEETSSEPVTIGCLSIYNKIEINPNLVEFSSNLLNIIQDATSRKKRSLLQNYFCDFWKRNIKNRHFTALFDFIMDFIIVPELEFEFKNGGIFDKEEHQEFKSADDVSAKPSRFVRETLIPTIRKYTENGKLTRFCILYGIEDNGEIKPLYHLKNDQIAVIEQMVNKELSNEKIQVNVHPVPFKGGIVLSVFMIPVIEMMM
jgi:hypothetical protein